ncbi:mannose-1-phosphate guanyltransferase alpha isoform X2 [Columba livia]|uniref:mannose-1-phosphate guanyltransferase alpha isoform X2 n=1 Tax=Columba livia TaxID=8932 RepID=UPI0031BA522C
MEPQYRVLECAVVTGPVWHSEPQGTRQAQVRGAAGICCPAINTRCPYEAGPAALAGAAPVTARPAPPLHPHPRVPRAPHALLQAHLCAQVRNACVCKVMHTPAHVSHSCLRSPGHTHTHTRRLPCTLALLLPYTPTHTPTRLLCTRAKSTSAPVHAHGRPLAHAHAHPPPSRRCGAPWRSAGDPGSTGTVTQGELQPLRADVSQARVRKRRRPERSRDGAEGGDPHRGPAEGHPVPAAVLRGAQAALPRGRGAHGAAPHRGLRQSAWHEGDPAGGLLPAPRGPQPLPAVGAAGVQDPHQPPTALPCHPSVPPDAHFSLLGSQANRTQALNYGCIVANADTQEVQHYVEKPSTFVSEIINCGIYLFTPAIFQHIGKVFQRNQQELVLEESSNGWQRAEVIRLEQDVFTALAGSGKLYVYKTDGFWSQIKSAGSAIYASRLYLNQYSKSHPERLAQNKPGGPIIRGNVYIHPTASIDSTAVLGPNVSIGEGVTVGAGVRVRESIVLHGASLHDHTCVLNTIVGWDSTIGRWARVEGTPSDPNPNDPYAKIDSETLFRDGRLTPSITILGCSVTIPAEVVILNSIVLPHKELSRSYKNQIIL